MILDEIAASTRKALARRKAATSPADMRAMARDALRPRPFVLKPISIIAEIKRATPRFPQLAPTLDPAAQARAYAGGGAAALSVLTDEPFFKTTLEDLGIARDAVALPVLRKEFVIDDYQIWETRARGADALLLIVRLLERGRLSDSLGLCAELGLAALVEAHTARELESALDAGARLVGVNNRNLDTFKTDLKTSILLRPLVPEGVVTVSESGIERHEDMVMLREAGFHAALIGESLIRARDPAAKLKELLHGD